MGLVTQIQYLSVHPPHTRKHEIAVSQDNDS